MENRRTSQRTIEYRRHFLMLACIAALLAATSRWRPWQGVIASSGLYGALHSSTLALSLRVPRSTRRKLAFIAIATVLTMLSVMVGMRAIRLGGTLPGMMGPALALATASGLGAASYGVLLRRTGIAELSPQGLVSITLGCVAATLAVLSLHALATVAGGLWFAVCWWFAFSAGLWYQDSA